MGKHIMIKNARCSFPQLFQLEVKGQNNQTFGPGITVILETKKHAAVLRVIKDTIKEVIAGHEKLKKMPPKDDKLCLRLPEREELLYIADNLMLKAGNPKLPVVMHKDQTRMTEADDKIYSGCLVNIKVEIWPQDNGFGRRVNAKLLAVQFAGEAASFDGSYVSDETAQEGFGSIDDDDMLDGASPTDAGVVDDDSGGSLLD